MSYESDKILAGVREYIIQEMKDRIDLLQSLTPAELRVLQAIVDIEPRNASNNVSLAQKLGVKPSTIRSHAKSLHIKLDVSDRTSMIVRAMRAGLVS